MRNNDDHLFNLFTKTSDSSLLARRCRTTQRNVLNPTMLIEMFSINRLKLLSDTAFRIHHRVCGHCYDCGYDVVLLPRRGGDRGYGWAPHFRAYDYDHDVLPLHGDGYIHDCVLHFRARYGYDCDVLPLPRRDDRVHESVPQFRAYDYENDVQCDAHESAGGHDHDAHHDASSLHHAHEMNDYARAHHTLHQHAPKVPRHT